MRIRWDRVAKKIQKFSQNDQTFDIAKWKQHYGRNQRPVSLPWRWQRTESAERTIRGIAEAFPACLGQGVKNMDHENIGFG